MEPDTIALATPDDYREYLNLHGKTAENKTRMGELAERIVADLNAGGKNQPKGLPFRCVLQPRTITKYDWKGAFQKFLLFSMRMRKADAEEKLEQTAAKFEKKTVEALVVERNKEFTV